MKKIIKLVLIFFFLSFQNQILFSQDSLISNLASQNLKTFSYELSGFSGKGWDYILNEINKSSNVLIGEYHFTNEIPAFVSAIANQTKFDNFYIEVDPYSTEIIEKTLKKLSDQDLQKFNEANRQLFSFYALEPEYKLLKQIVDSGTNLLGSDQILMYADRLIFQDVVSWSKSPEARNIYNDIIEESTKHLEDFFQDPRKPMYFMTPAFDERLSMLEALDLSPKENMIIEDVKRSLEIYKERSHNKRVQLLLHQLMKDYSKWKNSKNLFKYGANHLARGESFLTVHDIGNVVANVTKSNYEESFHIMIIGKIGMQGAPFETFPPTPVNSVNGRLSSLKPFYDLVQGKEWHSFNMIPVREALEKGELHIDNKTLLRAIKGYDVLVIIPEVTAAEF